MHSVCHRISVKSMVLVTRKLRRGLVVVIAVEDHKYFIAPGMGLGGELTDVDCDDIAEHAS